MSGHAAAASGWLLIGSDGVIVVGVLFPAGSRQRNTHRPQLVSLNHLRDSVVQKVTDRGRLFPSRGVVTNNFLLFKSFTMTVVGTSRTDGFDGSLVAGVEERQKGFQYLLKTKLGL